MNNVIQLIIGGSVQAQIQRYSLHFKMSGVLATKKNCFKMNVILTSQFSIN